MGGFFVPFLVFSFFMRCVGGRGGMIYVGCFFVYVDTWVRGGWVWKKGKKGCSV